ncbi:MAG TPA: ATP-binding protein [Cytophagaceae bacterium]|jgi:hypothetical protein|nr:ATP-binding protein [Cytophagaceae bacterium]
MKNNGNFSFAFSLEVLNHLGRGLYRSFATVIAEAVSNSWDAEATDVKITLDANKLIVEDNGKGMNDEDFQERFLTVGYSRREDSKNKSKRNVIGRKGIGKLAMLSISEKVTIISKKQGQNITGGIVNNKQLDKEIKVKGSYFLGNLSNGIKSKFPRSKKSGTIIIFESIKTKLNSPDIIRKYLATQFNFIFSLKKNDSFTIVVNKKKINEKDLKELDDNTQFIWFMGKEDKKRKSRYVNLEESRTLKEHSFKFGSKLIDIKGYIASVKLPKHLLLRGSKGDFKASINLFTNGRLRQENLFQEITSKQLPEEYLYGEIHVDGFEDEENDRFTSSREGIIKDDPLYQKFLEELKKIQTIVLKEWNELRIKNRHEADIETDKRPGYEVRMEESRNRRAKDFENKIGENIKDKNIKKTLKDVLKDLSYKNTLVYQDLFILENIFREYIKFKKIKENNFNTSNDEEKEVIDYIKSTRGLRKKDEERHALKGKIIKTEHYLNYADLWCLATIVDILIKNNPKKPIPKKYRKELSADAKEINPIRNPIMHTNEVTDHVMNWDKIKNVVDYIEKLK